MGCPFSNANSFARQRLNALVDCRSVEITKAARQPGSAKLAHSTAFGRMPTHQGVSSFSKLMPSNKEAQGGLSAIFY
jgi:hypothetical protein